MEDQEPYVSTRVRGRRCTVPRWVYLEWEQGGLKSLISQFGLERSYDNPVEDEVIRNITRFSYALRRFYLMHDGIHGHLTKLERHLLATERRVMNEMPNRSGHDICIEIAKRMSGKKGVYTPNQIKAMLEDVSQRLVDLQAIVEQKNSFESVLKRWKREVYELEKRRGKAVSAEIA